MIDDYQARKELSVDACEILAGLILALFAIGGVLCLLT